MRIYIAAPYSDKMLARQRAAELRADGHTVTSTWLEESYAPDTQLTDLAPEQNAIIAADDLEDIDSSDLVILFSLAPTQPFVRGGRHFESGYAVGKGIDVVVCGPCENAFHSLHLMPEFMKKSERGKIVQFPEWGQVKTYLRVLDGLENTK